jgi:hypothetical protein
MTKELLFTQDNTCGYTDEQLAEFNREAEIAIPEIMERYGIDEDQAGKAFADEIGRRY